MGHKVTESSYVVKTIFSHNLSTQTFAKFVHIFQKVFVLLFGPRSFLYFGIQSIYPSTNNDDYFSISKKRNRHNYLHTLDCLVHRT